MSENDPNAERRLWSSQYEALLVDLWVEYKNDYLGSRKKVLIQKDMSKRLQLKGLKVGPSVIRSKMDNLTRRYKKEHAKLSEGEESSWKHYAKLHPILSAPRIYNPDQSIKSDLSSQEDDDISIEGDVTAKHNSDIDFYLDADCLAAKPLNRSAAKKRALRAAEAGALCATCGHMSEPASKKFKSDQAERLLALAEARTKYMAELVEDTRNFHKSLLQLIKGQLNIKKSLDIGLEKI